MLNVWLNNRILEFSSDQSLSIEDGVEGIFGILIFSWISNESLRLSEGDIRWSGSIALVIGNDLNFIVLPASDTGIGSS
jgi:hypothetical protein